MIWRMYSEVRMDFLVTLDENALGHYYEEAENEMELGNSADNCEHLTKMKELVI